MRIVDFNTVSPPKRTAPIRIRYPAPTHAVQQHGADQHRRRQCRHHHHHDGGAHCAISIMIGIMIAAIVGLIDMREPSADTRSLLQTVQGEGTAAP
jgi:hypothetical protein